MWLANYKNMTYGIRVTAGNNIIQVDSENSDIYGIGNTGTINGTSGYIPATNTDLIFLRFPSNIGTSSDYYNDAVVYNLTGFNPNMGGTGKGGYKVIGYPTPQAAWNGHHGGGNSFQFTATGYDYAVYTNNPQNIDETQEYGLQIRDKNEDVKFDTRAFSSFALYVKNYWIPGILPVRYGGGANWQDENSTKICGLDEWISANWMIDLADGSSNWKIAHWIEVAKNYTPPTPATGTRTGYYAGCWSEQIYGDDFSSSPGPFPFWRLLLIADIPE